MKKRFVSACMVGLLAVSLAGCGGAGNSAAEAAKTTAEEPKTEAAYTWSDPYMDNSQVFVVTADSGISTLADLAGKVVEVQTDSSAEAALKDNQELSSSFGTLQTVADYNTAFMDLEMGAVDAIAMDVIVAGYQIEQREDGDNYVILEETLAAEEYGIGFKKGNEELRDKVQTTLEEMAADGTMAEISNKWFGRDVTVIGK